MPLSPHTVRVWLVHLDQPPHVVRRLETMLSADERNRAERFRFAHLYKRFVVGRGMLRELLASYIGTTPALLRFHYGPYGKPTLEQEPGSTALHFNVSHSNAMALIAVASGRMLGIDLEYCCEVPDAQMIADRFFSPRERTALREVPAEQKLLAFYSCWTRKEAYIKAHGDGLGMALDGFDVDVEPDLPIPLLRSSTDPDETARWTARTLRVPVGYVAALVVEGHDWELSMSEWP